MFVHIIIKVLNKEDSNKLNKELKSIIDKAKFDIYQFNIFPKNWEELFDGIKYL